MKKTPLNYYVNLTITEGCINYYKVYNPKGSMSDCFSWFTYVEVYIKSNSNLPLAVERLVMKLIRVLGEVYGFNIDKSMKCIIKYFIDNDYDKYLDFVMIRNEYLENKKLN